MASIIRSAVGSQCSVGFLSFLKSNGIKVTGTDITEDNVGRYFVDNYYKVPKASNEKRALEAYKCIIRKERASCLISGPESEIILFSKYKNEFSRLGVDLFHPPYETLKIITDKWCAYNFFLDKKILMPVSSLLDRDLSVLDENIVLKPRKGRGSSGIKIIDKQKIAKIDKSSLKDYFAQNFIKGEEFTVDFLCGYDGRILNIVPRKRLVTDSGISIVSEIVIDAYLVDYVKKICSYLIFVGGNCAQFVKDKKGNYYLIDINPRFGGGSILSIMSSKDFQNNIISLLKKEYKKLIYGSESYEIKKMFRYYEEYYVN